MTEKGFLDLNGVIRRQDPMKGATESLILYISRLFDIICMPEFGYNVGMRKRESRKRFEFLAKKT